MQQLMIVANKDDITENRVVHNVFTSNIDQQTAGMEGCINEVREGEDEDEITKE